MFRKLTLALVAAASLSAVALAPSTASAGGGGKGWHPHHHPHLGVGFVVGNPYGFGYGNSCYQTRLVPTKFGYRYRLVNVCAW